MGGCQRKQLGDFGLRISDCEFDSGQRKETGDRSQKKGILLWERLSAAILPF